MDGHLAIFVGNIDDGKENGGRARKLSFGEFLGQHMDIEQDEVAKLSEVFGTHPFLLRRIKAIADFHDSDQYRRLSAVVS